MDLRSTTGSSTDVQRGHPNLELTGRDSSCKIGNDNTTSKSKMDMPNGLLVIDIILSKTISKDNNPDTYYVPRNWNIVFSIKASLTIRPRRPWVFLSGMCEEFESNAKNMTIRIEGHPGEHTECVKRKTYQYHHHAKTGIMTNRMKLFIDSWFECYYFPKAHCHIFWENSMKLQASFTDFVAISSTESPNIWEILKVQAKIISYGWEGFGNCFLE